MGKTLFNKEIKPLIEEMNVHTIPVGDVSKFYRRIDLDRVEEEYVRRSGQSGLQNNEEITTCESTQDCQKGKEAHSGKSIRKSVSTSKRPSYAKVRAHAIGS
jgi:hypothetical protein